MSNYVMISYMLKDGTMTSFIDPRAVKERREALSHIRGNYNISALEWAKTFGKVPKVNKKGG